MARSPIRSDQFCTNPGLVFLPESNGEMFDSATLVVCGAIEEIQSAIPKLEGQLTGRSPTTKAPHSDKHHRVED